MAAYAPRHAEGAVHRAREGTGQPDDVRPVAVQLGITDNRSTEIVGGELKEGDTLVVSEAPAAATKPSSVGLRLF